MSISRRIFFIGLGALAVFCCYSATVRILEYAPHSWPYKVGDFILSALYLVAYLMAVFGILFVFASLVGVFYISLFKFYDFIFTAWDNLFTACKNYKNNVEYVVEYDYIVEDDDEYYDDEYYDELDKFLKLPVREIKNEIISSPDEPIIIEDKLTDIPCEVFLLDMWHEAKIIRGIKLLTGGIDRESSKVYLVEFGQSPPLRQWLSAQLIRQQSPTG